MRCIKECIARNTYPQFGLDPLCLVVEAPAIPIELIGGVGRSHVQAGLYLPPMWTRPGK